MTAKRDVRAVRAARENREMLYRLANMDFAKIEQRIAARAGTGEDIHADFASQFFGIPLDKVTQPMRRVSKVLNFLALYSNDKAEETGKSRSEVLADLLARSYTGRKRMEPPFQHA